jgi:6,7-dimethyl-8-ribityllumazine synthase
MSAFVPSRPRNFGQRRRNFAIVASQYNAEFVNGLVEHARRELEAIASTFHVTVYEVPGAFEIPVVVQEIAAREAADAIIALGVIIEGATQHASLIGRAITDALMRVALEFRVPVIHEVLLVKDEAQARERCLGEEINRGTEAARTAARMTQLMTDLRAER